MLVVCTVYAVVKFHHSVFLFDRNAQGWLLQCTTKPNQQQQQQKNPETRDAQTIDAHTYDPKILCTVDFPLRHPNSFFFPLCILSVDEDFFFSLLFSSQMRFVFADYQKVTIHNSFFFLAIVTVNVCPPIFSARIFLLHRLLEVWSTFNIQQCLVCVWSAGTLNWYIFKTKYFYLNILVGLCPSKAYCSLASNEFFLSILMPLETFFYVSHLMLPVQCQWFCAKFHFSCSVPGHCTFFFYLSPFI